MTYRDGKIYAISEGGMFDFKRDSRAYHTYTTIDGLSGVSPTTIFRHPDSDIIFIGYPDGTINSLDFQGMFGYITDISRTNLFTTKRINRFEAWNEILFIATEFGIVAYDVEKRETRFSITKIGGLPTGTPVKDIAVGQGKLWAAMDNGGLFSIDLNAPNLTLPQLWEEVDGTNGLPAGQIARVCAANDRIYTNLRDTIFELPASGSWQWAPFPNADFTYLNAYEGEVMALSNGDIYVLHADQTLEYVDDKPSILSCFYADGVVWGADQSSGLLWFRDDGSRVYSSPAGPRTNYVTDLAAGNGELYIAPRGKKGPSDRWFDKSGIPYYNFMEGGWTLNTYLNGALNRDTIFQDFARVYYDEPTQTAYVGSFGEGVVVLKDGEPIETYTDENSGLISFGGRNRVGGLTLDAYGNLYVVQIVNDYPIHVLTPEGQWYRHKPTDIDPIGIMIDDYDNKWIINQGKGITVYDDNYTPDNPLDDRVKSLTSDFGRGLLPDNSVFALAKDLDQQVWVGTATGVTIFYDPSLMWTADFQDAACPLIDGFCLLRDQNVWDIAVDAANRKWLATENGVYLVNADGTELLLHFTTDNSPLFDNDVRAVTLDQSTGEVFFGTSRGLISYMGNSIQGVENMADSLYAFPNPVYENFEGVVMLKNMDQNSRIKITTADGRLVRELDSFGGEVPWDMTDTYGNKVPPGIYLVMVATADGKSAGISQLAILERSY